MIERWVLHTRSGDEFYLSLEAAQARYQVYRRQGYFSSRPVLIQFPVEAAS